MPSVPSGPVPATAQIEEVVVLGDLDSLPDESVQSVFGFPKSLLHTPRSVSSISEEMIARFDMRDIDELIAVTPGSFTQSFFGVAGSLDIRGTPGETYFRGMRRLDNPGNYPTPIGASDRIDIVRGPPSPIHGPAKIGGYLNFYPKSARIEESGEFIGAATGTAALSTGNWNKRILSAEVGGPGRLGTQDYGYWLYAEAENSGSYYRDSRLDQTLLQASFDADLGERLQVQFGGMVHAYLGNEVAGWNRLTQQLVDRGIYITGQPRPLDRDGDGRISHQEFDLDGDGFTDLNPFAAGLAPGTPGGLDTGAPDDGLCSIGPTPVYGCHPEWLGLRNSGIATLDGSQVLNAPEDFLDTDVITLYLDAILHSPAGAWTWSNRLFYERTTTSRKWPTGFPSFTTPGRSSTSWWRPTTIESVLPTCRCSLSVAAIHELRPRQRLHQRVFRPARPDAARRTARYATACHADRRRLHTLLHRRLRQRRAGSAGGRDVGERFQRACGPPLRQPRHAEPPAGGEAPASQRP